MLRLWGRSGSLLLWFAWGATSVLAWTVWPRLHACMAVQSAQALQHITMHPPVLFHGWGSGCVETTQQTTTCRKLVQHHDLKTRVYSAFKKKQTPFNIFPVLSEYKFSMSLQRHLILTSNSAYTSKLSPMFEFPTTSCINIRALHFPKPLKVQHAAQHVRY